eukprot:751162-Hanusia_phi.AAC.3
MGVAEAETHAAMQEEEEGEGEERGRGERERREGEERERGGTGGWEGDKIEVVRPEDVWIQPRGPMWNNSAGVDLSKAERFTQIKHENLNMKIFEKKLSSNLSSSPDDFLASLYKKGSLKLLDQLKLPFEFEYMDITTCEEVSATSDCSPTPADRLAGKMNVRGAPAIAISAALALAVEATRRRRTDLASDEEAKKWLCERLEYLKTSRPTAVSLRESLGKPDVGGQVNLFNDCDRLACFVQALSGSASTVTSAGLGLTC